MFDWLLIVPRWFLGGNFKKYHQQLSSKTIPTEFLPKVSKVGLTHDSNHKLKKTSWETNTIAVDSRHLKVKGAEYLRITCQTKNYCTTICMQNISIHTFIIEIHILESHEHSSENHLINFKLSWTCISMQKIILSINPFLT